MHRTTRARLAGLVCLLAVTLTSRPALAQFNLSGDWSPLTHEDQPERGPGPELGDYLGLPITDGARLHADSWDASRLTLREHQCKVHTVNYIYRGPLQVRIWEEKDPFTQQLVAIKHWISTYEQARTIWMDGRPHPPAYAAHTWQGFSTGKFEGDILTVYTTHIKSEWTRRNGIPNSEFTTMVEHWVRHGNVATHRHRRHRPGVSDRAAGEEHRLPAERAAGRAAGSGPASTWTKWWARSRATSRTICPARARSMASSPGRWGFRLKPRAAGRKRRCRNTSSS